MIVSDAGLSGEEENEMNLNDELRQRRNLNDELRQAIDNFTDPRERTMARAIALVLTIEANPESNPETVKLCDASRRQLRRALGLEAQRSEPHRFDGDAPVNEDVIAAFKGRRDIYFNVDPRYTGGSPALVSQNTAMRVASQEVGSYEHALAGRYGSDERLKAERLGLSEIVFACYEVPREGGWLCLDLCTGAQFFRLYPENK